MLYLLAGLVENKNVLFVGKDGSLTGSKNLEEAKKLLPNLNGYHKAGQTWSTSASIWWMTFQPRILEFKNLEEVESALLDRKIQEHRNVSGSVLATTLKDDYAVKVVENGHLVQEGIEEAKPFYQQ